MFFASPWWLVGLGPVVGLAVYLLRGKRDAAVVPFLQLWGKPGAMPRVRSSLRPPPPCLLMLLMSMLLAVLAAAGPVLKSNQFYGSIAIILDRGITMSPVSRTGGVYRGVIDESATHLNQKFAGASVQLIPVPGDIQSRDIEHWSSIAATLKPTVLDTQAMLDTAVAAQLRDHPGQPVVVLSDRNLMSNNESILQVWPKENVSNIGISLIAARETPTPQLMVQLHNHSAKREVKLTITAGEKIIEKQVEFAADDESRNVFIDLPLPAPPVLKAELIGAGEARATHSAWLVRNSAAPKLEAISALPPGVENVIKAYLATSIPDQDSPRIAVTMGTLDDGQSGVVLVPLSQHREDNTESIIADHAVTRAVSKWPGSADEQVTAPPGYTTIVSRNGKSIVAIQELPVRKVWVNLSIENWETTPDFVVFFTNVFDWLGQKRSEEYRFELPGADGSWPGLYHRSDGEMIAVNSADVKWVNVKATDWEKRLSRFASESAVTPNESTKFCCAAIVVGLIGLALWPRLKQI